MDSLIAKKNPSYYKYPSF